MLLLYRCGFTFSYRLEPADSFSFDAAWYELETDLNEESLLSVLLSGTESYEPVLVTDTPATIVPIAATSAIVTNDSAKHGVIYALRTSSCCHLLCTTELYYV